MGLDVNYCFPQYLITLSVYGGKTTLHTQYIFSHRPTCLYTISPLLYNNEVQNLNVKKSGYYVTISFNAQFVPFMFFPSFSSCIILYIVQLQNYLQFFISKINKIATLYFECYKLGGE